MRRREVAQLQQDGPALHVGDRGHPCVTRPRPAEHEEDPVHLPPRPGQVAKAPHRRAHRDVQRRVERRLSLFQDVAGQTPQSVSGHGLGRREQRVHDPAGRDAHRLPPERLAVQRHQVHQPLPAELLHRVLRLRQLERQHVEHRASLDPQPGRRRLHRRAPLKQREQQIAPDPTFDVARRPRVDHVQRRQPRRLRQRPRRVLRQGLLALHHPDRTDRLAAHAHRHGEARIDVEVLHGVDLDHPVGAPQPPVQRANPGRVGDLPAQDGTLPRFVDALSLDARVREDARAGVLDGDGAAHQRRDGVGQGEQVPDRNARHAGRLARVHPAPDRGGEDPVEVAPAHLVRDRKQRHPGGSFITTAEAFAAAARFRSSAPSDPSGATPTASATEPSSSGVRSTGS